MEVTNAARASRRGNGARRFNLAAGLYAGALLLGALAVFFFVLHHTSIVHRNLEGFREGYNDGREAALGRISSHSEILPFLQYGILAVQGQEVFIEYELEKAPGEEVWLAYYAYGVPGLKFAIDLIPREGEGRRITTLSPAVNEPVEVNAGDLGGATSFRLRVAGELTGQRPGSRALFLDDLEVRGREAAQFHSGWLALLALVLLAAAVIFSAAPRAKRRPPPRLWVKGARMLFRWPACARGCRLYWRNAPGRFAIQAAFALLLVFLLNPAPLVTAYSFSATDRPHSSDRQSYLMLATSFALTGQIGLFAAPEKTTHEQLLRAGEQHLRQEGKMRYSNDRAPLWPALLGASYWLLGHGMPTLHFLQWGVLVPLVCVALFYLAKRTTGSWLAATVIVGFYYLFFPVGSIAFMRPLLFLGACSTLAFAFAYFDHRHWGWLVASGLAAAVMVLTRYSFILLVPVLGVFFLVMHGKNWRRGLLAAAVFCMVAAVPNGCWVARNYVLLDSAQHTTRGGWNFLARTQNAGQRKWVSRVAPDVVERELGVELSAEERGSRLLLDPYYYDVAWQRVRTHPWRWIKGALIEGRILYDDGIYADYGLKPWKITPANSLAAAPYAVLQVLTRLIFQNFYAAMAAGMIFLLLVVPWRSWWEYVLVLLLMAPIALHGVANVMLVYVIHGGFNSFVNVFILMFQALLLLAVAEVLLGAVLLRGPRRRLLLLGRGELWQAQAAVLLAIAFIVLTGSTRAAA